MPHIAERTCVGCRTKRPKTELVRVVRTLDGTIELDARRHTPGRGGYFCRAKSCWQTGLSKRALDRTLRTAIPAAAREALLQAGRSMGVK